MSKKILHLCDNLYYGGAQNVIIATINGLPEFEHFVIYLAKLEELKSEIKCPAYYVEQKKGLKLYLTIREVYKFVKDNHIDIIHCNAFNSMIIGRVVALLAPAVTQITTYHGMSYLPSLRGSKKWAFLDRLIYKKSFVAIAVSETVKKHTFEKISKHRQIEVITNSVSRDFFDAGKKKISSFTPILKFVTVANNFPLKNIQYLLDIFSKVDPAKMELHIYGGMMEPLQDIVAAKDLTNIYFYGIRPINGNLLKQYDIYISSSLTEGCPLSVMEAMAVGLPTMLSAIEAFKEITDNTGYFFDPGTTTSGVEKLEHIYENQGALSGLSEGNFNLADKFRPEIFIAKIRSIYLKT